MTKIGIRWSLGLKQGQHTVTETQFLQILQQTLWMVVLLSSPVLIISMIVGLLISILQAITQIQESSLTFVPKILISLAIIIFTGPWMVQQMVIYTGDILNSLVNYAH
jgi:flagellar biosynthesis protein FliQ